MSLDFCLQAAAVLLEVIWSMCWRDAICCVSRVEVNSGDVSGSELSLWTGRGEPRSADGKGGSHRVDPSLDEFLLSQAPLVDLSSSWMSWVWDCCRLHEG